MSLLQESEVLPMANKDDISIVLCGQAGQGIQSIEYVLVRVLKLAGYNVFATKEYMSRIRGGTNSTEIRVSSNQVRAVTNRIDILIPLNKEAIQHVQKRISSKTIILTETENIDEVSDQRGCVCIEVPFTKIATNIGDKIYSNIVAVGVVAGFFQVDFQLVNDYIRKYFSGKSDDILNKNLEAAKAGYKLGCDLVNSGKIGIAVKPNDSVSDQILLSGAEAVALGAIAGGCNFIYSYPMSPSTAVLVFLAQHAKEFNIVAEQAEDEIAAINMAIGAWYAGARAMVTTSGGGFSLMVEGLSLAAMLESPMVIHLGQRPGPATGLPTRTEQGDLELALYAGHGEFPRIILAPGTLEEAFYLTQKAFNLADKYQVPVFLLTDQYFLDSFYNTADFNLSDIKAEKHIVKTEKDYRRYEFATNGISPRGIPGYGRSFVCVDSDEHDAEGHITEDLELRVKMVDKRLVKGKALMKDAKSPQLVGPKDYKTLVICWGSTYHIVDEAVKNLNRDDVAFAHFKQVHPLPKETAIYLEKAEKTIAIENNATGQFAKQIKFHTGINIDRKVLKYKGLSFTVEELVEKLGGLLD